MGLTVLLNKYNLQKYKWPYYLASESMHKYQEDSGTLVLRFANLFRLANLYRVGNNFIPPLYIKKANIKDQCLFTVSNFLHLPSKVV